MQRQNIPSPNIDFNHENKITFYIPCLHGVRAFAIILVLISHSIHTGLPSWLAATLSFGNLGTIGVRLFFLLSGFLITRILQSELQKTGSINFRKFFIRRLLRIFPCFYFFILTLFLLSEIKVIDVDGTALLFALLYIQNFVVFQNTELFPTSWLVKHSWSLSVEEQFYLIYPFLVKPLVRKIILNPIFFPLATTLVCTFFRALNYSYPDLSRATGGVFFMHADFLLYGGILSIHLHTIQIKLTSLLHPFKYLLLLVALSLAIYASHIEYTSGLNIIIFGNVILIGVIYILLFFLLFPNSFLGQLFENPWMKKIGLISYSLYVWQQLFLGSAEYWLNFKFVTIFPNNLILTFLCAVLSYWLIEKPFLRLKHRFS